jgi:hypothetical protein
VAVKWKKEKRRGSQYPLQGHSLRNLASPNYVPPSKGSRTSQESHRLGIKPSIHRSFKIQTRKVTTLAGSFMKGFPKEVIPCQAPLAHAYNPSYSGGRDQEDHSLKPAWGNSSQDPVSKNPSQK